MKLTLEMLESMNACDDGIEWFKQQNTEDVKTLIDNALASNDDKVLDFANWGICKLFTHEQKIQYAIFAAKLVLHIFEEKYPEDMRPRKAIEAAELYLKEPTEENKKAATAAYTAAATAAPAATRAAAYAAYAAAATAADDATKVAKAATVYAAAAAYAVAYAYAYDVDDDADDAAADAASYAYATENKIETMKTIIEYGKCLFNKNHFRLNFYIKENTIRHSNTCKVCGKFIKIGSKYCDKHNKNRCAYCKKFIEFSKFFCDNFCRTMFKIK